MAKPAVFEIEATITERGQTTVPAPIRKMLAVKKTGRIVFRGMPDGRVEIARTDESAVHTDPVISEFLDFLEQDMKERGKEAIRPIPKSFLDDYRELSELDLDLDGPLTGDDK